MKEYVQSIRPFIGANDFVLSRAFYRDFGFSESILSAGMSYFHLNGFGFYLQDAYVKDWVDNTMVFMEMTDLPSVLKSVQELNLPARYPGVRVSTIRHNEWGNEFFVHDPSGILWHIGEFAK